MECMRHGCCARAVMLKCIVWTKVLLALRIFHGLVCPDGAMTVFQRVEDFLCHVLFLVGVYAGRHHAMPNS